MCENFVIIYLFWPLTAYSPAVSQLTFTVLCSSNATYFAFQFRYFPDTILSLSTSSLNTKPCSLDGIGTSSSSPGSLSPLPPCRCCQPHPPSLHAAVLPPIRCSLNGFHCRAFPEGSDTARRHCKSLQLFLIRLPFRFLMEYPLHHVRWIFLLKLDRLQ